MPSKRLTKSAKSTSFDFGDYNAPAEEEESHQLSWRDDPERSLSDWTIVVRCEVTGASESFHVHKAMLAAGARWSEYFKSVFKSGMREGNTKTPRRRSNSRTRQPPRSPITSTLCTLVFSRPPPSRRRHCCISRTTCAAGSFTTR